MKSESDVKKLKIWKNGIFFPIQDNDEIGSIMVRMLVCSCANIFRLSESGCVELVKKYHRLRNIRTNKQHK